MANGFISQLDLTYISKNVDYTLLAFDCFVAVDCSGGVKIITLPTAVDREGRVYIIKKVDSSGNAVTVTPSGGQTIDGAANYSLASQYKYVSLISNGANWLVIGNN